MGWDRSKEGAGVIIIAAIVFIVAFLTLAITIPWAWYEANRNKRSHDEVERKLLESCPEYREYYERYSPIWKQYDR